MKKITTFIVLFLLIALNAQNYIQVNDRKISVEEFKNLYKNNIEAEGIKNALNSFIQYELMFQKSKKEKADTTYYFKSLYNSNIAAYAKPFYDSLVTVEVAKMNVSIDSLNNDEKKYILNNIFFKENFKDLKVDSTVLVEVNKFVGEDFLNKEKPNNFKGNKTIFSTKTGKFTQKDYAELLNQAQKEVVADMKLSDFLQKAYFYIRDKFILDDIRSNIDSHYPAYKKLSDELKRTIYVNYFIEKEIYHKADQDLAGKSEFLKSNAKSYTWPTRYELNIYRYQNKGDAKKIENWIKFGKTSDFINKQFDGQFIDNSPKVVFTTGYFPLNNKDLGEINPNQKIQNSTYRNAPAIINVIKEIPPVLMTVEEAGNTLRDDYRSFMFNKVLAEIKADANIVIPNELNN
ncbi:hypothetical protein KRX57_05580 [Weeksellaceae bacterium TAE3-ERU29]|nr:hypothetical protein [Weeksellaceae bacterium TAE3-ERU29]